MNIEIRKAGEVRAIVDYSLVRNQQSDIASTINQDKIILLPNATPLKVTQILLTL